MLPLPVFTPRRSRLFNLLPQFGESAYSAMPFALNAEFAPVLKRVLDFYNVNPASVDRIAAVKSELHDVKGVMVHNIEKVRANSQLGAATSKR